MIRKHLRIVVEGSTGSGRSSALDIIHMALTEQGFSVAFEDGEEAREIATRRQAHNGHYLRQFKDEYQPDTVQFSLAARTLNREGR